MFGEPEVGFQTVEDGDEGDQYHEETIGGRIIVVVPADVLTPKKNADPNEGEHQQGDARREQVEDELLFHISCFGWS